MSTDYGYTSSTAVYPVREKDPSSIQNFDVNWAKELNGETISTSTWELDGLINVTDSNTNDTTTIRVSGGSEGQVHRLQNTITTSGSQTFRKALPILVRQL